MQAIDPLEQEQIDILKSYWQRWWRWAVGVVIVIIVALMGYFINQSYNKKQANIAAGIFETLEEKMRVKDTASAQQLVDNLIRDYPRQKFTALAALMLAKQSFQAWEATRNEGDVRQAVDKLEWVIKHSQDEALRDLARLRLSHVFMGQKNYQQVISTTEKVETQAVKPALLELRGDAFMLLNQRGDAKKAYLEAQKLELALAEKYDVKKALPNPMLKMKIDSVGQ